VAIILQMFSIDDKSDEFGGQSIGEMNPTMFAFNQSIVVCNSAVCRQYFVCND